MATEAGQDEEPAAGTSFSQPKENVDTHLTMRTDAPNAANDGGHHEQIPEMGSRV